MQQITTQQEAPMARRWAIDDAPRDYTAKMISAVVGIEIVVDEWVGKMEGQPEPAAR